MALHKKIERLQLTHETKVFWPKEGYTKGDVIAYYRSVSQYILPYLKNRPESLHRHPDGITGENFFQKDVDHLPPKWVKTVRIHSNTAKKDIDYLVCQDLNTLLYMVNLGCIELNPWNSRIGSLHKPDYMVFDLDPEGIDFGVVVKTAHVVRTVLEKAGIKSYPKTSGKTGLHIYVPLGAKYEFRFVRRFAEFVAIRSNERAPSFTSVERLPKKRKKRVYIDFLQNSFSQTLVSPYSLRPVAGAPVSAPLLWSEVNVRLRPQRFTIRTIYKRLKDKDDPWKPVLGKGIDMRRALRHLEKNL